MSPESPQCYGRPVGSRMRARGTVVFAACTLLLAACSGGGSKVSTGSAPSSTQSSSPRPVSAAAPSPTVLKMTIASYGPVLTDAKGFVLYTYTADEPGGPGCTGACLKLWPPLLLPAGQPAPIAGPGVSGLGTVAKPEGTEVTYEGLPLYTYLNDTRPGQVTGQDLVDSGGTWILATVGSPAAASSTTTSTSPTTQPSVTSPPATQPPATKVPITSPPITRAPIMHAPITRPTVTQAPMTSPPVTQSRVTSPPATMAPTTPRTTQATTPPPGVSY
jgi:predicted lipoprotein with Yx(FWY)xxD motif